MSLRKIVTNSLYYGIVPKLPLFINVLLLPLITPYLTTFDYGVQGIISSYTGLIAMIAPLGLNVHLSNSYYEYPRHFNLIWGRVLFLFLVSGVFFGVFNMLLLSIVLPFVLSLKLIFLCFVGSIQIFLFSNGWLAQHLFPLTERPKPLVFGNLIASSLGLGVSFVLIYFFRMGYWGLVAPIAVSTTIAFIIFIKFVWVDYKIQPIIERKISRLKEMLRIALPLIPHSLGFVLLASSARIVMSWYHVPYDDIGLFSHGCSMGEYIVIISTALTTAIVPQMQVSYRKNDFVRYRRLYYLCQLVALLSSALICIWMDEVYSILVRNEQLSQSSSIAKLMCFANVILPFYQFMSAPVFINKHTKQLLWLVFIPGILNLLLCSILIPIWGYRVAIFSTMISYWSQTAIPFFINYYKKNVKIWLGSQKKICLLLVVLTSVVIISNYMGTLPTLWRIIGSLILVSSFYVYYYKKINLVFD